MSAVKPFLCGMYRSEEGTRTCLVKQGTKLVHILLLEGTEVRRFQRPLSETRFIKILASTDEPAQVEAVREVARIYLGPNRVSNTPREMTKVARSILEEIIAL